MLTFTSLLCLLALLLAPVDLYCTQREYVCCKPIRNEDTCEYYENPILLPLFETRINNPKCYPVCSPTVCQHCVDEAHLRKRDVSLSPRSNFYFSNPFRGGSFSDDNTNYGFHSLNGNLKSLGDLIELSSDEVGVPRPVKRDPVKLWKLDEVKSMSTPKLLPDVILESDYHEDNSNPSLIREGIIDDHDRNLGRFVVVEDDPPMPMIMNVGNPELAPMNHVDNIGLNEQYIVAPSYTIPEIYVNKVTARREPDFMEELQQIKLSAGTTPTNVYYPYMEESFTEDSHLKEHITEVPDKEIVGDKPEALPLSTMTEKSNSIEKESERKITPKPSHKKKDSGKKNKKVEPKVDVLETPAAAVKSVVSSTSATVSSTTLAPKKQHHSSPTTEKSAKAKATKHEKEKTPETLSRFYDHKETLLDGLLSVM